MNTTTNISSGFCKTLAKPFEQLFLWKRFSLNISQEITVFTNMISLLYFSVRPSRTLERVFFDKTFSEARDQTCTDCLKKDTYIVLYIVGITSVR